MNKPANYIFIRNMFWYLIGTFLPILVGALRTPIFTRIFSPTEYGYYTYTLVTYNLIEVVFFSWLITNIWRYYNYYKNIEKVDELQSNIFFLFILSSIFSLSLSLILSFYSNNKLTTDLIWMNCAALITNNFITILLMPIRLEDNALKYNIVNATRVILSFVLLCFLTFILHKGIVALLESIVIINIFYIVFLILNGKYSFKIGLIKRSHLKTFLSFGFVGLLLNIFTMLINVSDRYIIDYFCGYKILGIYNQVYQLGLISIAALVNVYWGVINPRINRQLEEDINKSVNLTSEYIFIYILLLLPITTYFSIFAKQISIIMLGPMFREGYPMIPFVMFSSFFYGLFYFYQNRLMFKKKYISLVGGCIIAFIINVSLNLVLIPNYSYYWGAYTTFITYFILLLILYFSDDLRMNVLKTYFPVFRKVVLMLLLQILTDYFLRKFWEINILLTILEGIFFMAIYVITLGKNTLEGILKFKW